MFDCRDQGCKYWLPWNESRNSFLKRKLRSAFIWTQVINNTLGFWLIPKPECNYFLFHQASSASFQWTECTSHIWAHLQKLKQTVQVAKHHGNRTKLNTTNSQQSISIDFRATIRSPALSSHHKTPLSPWTTGSHRFMPWLLIIAKPKLWWTARGKAHSRESPAGQNLLPCTVCFWEQSEISGCSWETQSCRKLMS